MVDIFGFMVEFMVGDVGDPGDYFIGEKIDINGDGIFLCYMDKLFKDGVSVDCWLMFVVGFDLYYFLGVGNYFFYLFVEGSGVKMINGVVYNSLMCNGVLVLGIGCDVASAIWYCVLMVYMISIIIYL